MAPSNVVALLLTARDDLYSMTKGTILTVPAPGVLANDTIQPGANANVEFLSPFPPGTFTPLIDSGGFTYTPDPTFVGSAFLSYLVHTSIGDSNVATVTIQVDQRPSELTAYSWQLFEANRGALGTPRRGGLHEDCHIVDSVLASTRLAQ
jgi:Big-like domain-containing protein